MIDTLGDRMKGFYEDVFRQHLPRRTYAIVRIDGKAFHTYTKGLPRPYCPELSEAMDYAAIELARTMQGTKLAYGQSDEYSFLLTDFDDIDTQAWFNGNIQKIASVSASTFTAHFNTAWSQVVGKVMRTNRPYTPAMFDARVFVIPSRTEVMNYFVWRQQDATRNSLTMLASAHYSHKELMGKKAANKHDLLHAKGINWNNEPTAFKRGRVIRRVPTTKTVSYVHKVTKIRMETQVTDTAWVVDSEIPIFQDDHSYLEALVPSTEAKAATA